MDTSGILSVVDKFGFVGVVSFGLTYITSVVADKKFLYNLSTLQKMLIQGIFAFLLVFVPINFQNVFLNNLKISIGIVAGSTTFW